MECKICQIDLPDYIYIEDNIDEWICPECCFKNYVKCSICNENLGITSSDIACGILGDDWIEMCEHCAIEFKHAKNNHKCLD